MAIIQQLVEALEKLRERDKPERDRLSMKASLTPEEEVWLDDTSNHTELAQLLECLRAEDDPDTAYLKRQQAGLTSTADALLQEVSLLNVNLRPTTPQSQLTPPPTGLRRSSRESKSPKSPWESLAIPSSPANPSGLPGYRGYQLLPSATDGDDIAIRMGSTNFRSRKRQSSTSHPHVPPPKSNQSRSSRITTPTMSQQTLAPFTSSSQVSTQMTATEVSDSEDEAATEDPRRPYMVFFQKVGAAYKCLLCLRKYNGVSFSLSNALTSGLQPERPPHRWEETTSLSTPKPGCRKVSDCNPSTSASRVQDTS